MAWGAMLLKTGVKLDLITDLEMLDMIEKDNEAGFASLVASGMFTANSHYLPYHDPNTPSNYIFYEDANSLDACAMMQLLPYKDLKFNKDISLRDLAHQIKDLLDTL